MPTIKQLIAEIQLAPIPDHHKRYIAKELTEAAERLKLRAPRKPMKITNAKNLITLEEWEERNGKLNIGNLYDWICKNKLCAVAINNMVIEFREEMMAKGKQYANFKLAFITYLKRGYLSKPFKACTLEQSPYNNSTIVHTKGVQL